MLLMFFGCILIKVNNRIITEQKQRIEDNMKDILEGMEIIKTGENIINKTKEEYDFLEQKIVINKNIIQMCDKQMNEWRNIHMEKTINVGFMEHSGVNPSAAGGCKVEDPTGPPTRSQVDFTELCSVTSTCDDDGDAINSDKMFIKDGVFFYV